MEKQQKKVGVKERVGQVFELIIWALPQVKKVFDIIWDIARGSSARKGKR